MSFLLSVEQHKTPRTGKGISYHAINQGKKAPPQEWIDRLFREAVGSTTSNRMTFPDFLRLTLLSTEEAKAAAAKRMAYS